MLHSVKRFVLPAAVVAGTLLAGAGAGSAQDVERFTMTAGHPPVFSWVRLLDEYVRPGIDQKLEAAGSPVKIEWTTAYGGTLAKIGAESDAIRSGVSDMGIVAFIFEAAKFPLEQVSLFAPFATDDILKIGRAIEKVRGQTPAMQKAWEDAHAQCLGAAAIDTYHLVSKFPVSSIDDLQGKKILAPGPAANWIKGTGAIGVAGNLTTYYNDLKTGVADGVIVSAAPAFAVKLHEVASHVTKVNIGAQSTGCLAINTDRLAALPPEVQQIIREVGAGYTEKFAEVQMATADAAIEGMKAGGATISELSPAERKRWADALPPLGKEWAEAMAGRGLPGQEVLAAYIQALEEQGVEMPRDWSK
ncbi:MAG: C4-dicarboxylate TRAP transporter substrate-binding protein [Sneathiellaceae bacterium]